MEKRGNSIVVAGSLSFIILILLVFSGPASAFNLGLVSDLQQVELGKVITFSANVEVQDADGILDYLIFKLNGLMTTTCKFNAEGNVISGCNGITIEKTLDENNSLDFGYGYERTLEYLIRLNTTGYSPGVYETYLSVFTSLGSSEERFDNVEIFGQTERITKYSISAKKITADLIYLADDTEFKNARVDFSAWLNIHQNLVKREMWTQGKGTLTINAVTSTNIPARLSLNLEQIGIIENSISRLYTDNSANLVVYWKRGKGEPKKLSCSSVKYDINKTTRTAEITGQCSQEINFKISNLPVEIF